MDAWLLKSELQQLLGREEDSEATLEQALRHFPHSAKALVAAGFERSNSRRHQEARAHFEQALEIGGQDVWASIGLGFVSSDEHDYDAALRLANQAREMLFNDGLPRDHKYVDAEGQFVAAAQSLACLLLRLPAGQATALPILDDLACRFGDLKSRVLAALVRGQSPERKGAHEEWIADATEWATIQLKQTWKGPAENE